MRRPDLSRRRRLVAVIALATTAVAALSGGGTAGASAMHHGFRQTNLVSDIPGRAQLTDPNLVNPWGLAAGPTTPLWVADNGTGLATLYAGGTGGAPFSIAPLVFTVPMGAPTGQVFNGLERLQAAHQRRPDAGQVHLRLRGRRDLGLDADQSDPAQRPHQAGGAGRDLQGARDRVLPPPPGAVCGRLRPQPGVGGRLALPRHEHPRGVHGSHAAERLLAVRHPEHRPVGRGQLRQARARRRATRPTAPASASSTSTRRTAAWSPASPATAR